MALAVPLWSGVLAGLGDAVAGNGPPGLGDDYRAFSFAGELARTGRVDLLYETDAYDAVDAARFVYPPPYALLMIPLSLLPVPVGFAVWTALGAAAFVAAARLLRLPLAFPLVAAVGITGIANVWYGQNAWFTLLALAAAFRLAGDGGRAGAAVGPITWYKPQLLAGLVLWWAGAPARTRRWWWSTAAVAAGGAAVAAVVLPGAWTGWAGTIGAALYGDDVLAVDQVQFTLRALWGLLLGPGPAATGLTVVGTALLAVGAVTVLRRVADRPALAVGMGVLAGLVLVPHLLVYDLALLLVPLAALWHAYPSRRPLWAVLAAVIAGVAPISTPIAHLQLEAWGRALPMGPVALLALAVAAGVVVLREENGAPT